MLLIGYALGFMEVIIAALTAMLSLAAGVGVLIMKLPATNPLRALLTALLVRLGVSLGGAVVAAPMAAIPGIGDVGDAAVAAGVLYFWLTFFTQLYRYLKDFRFTPPAAPGASAAHTAPPTIIVPAQSNGGLKT